MKKKKYIQDILAVIKSFLSELVALLLVGWRVGSEEGLELGASRLIVPVNIWRTASRKVKQGKQKHHCRHAPSYQQLPTSHARCHFVGKTWNDGYSDIVYLD